MDRRGAPASYCGRRRGRRAARLRLHPLCRIPGPLSRGGGAFYAANEPLQLLLLPGKGAARLLARKIFTAWRNYFLMTAPFAVLALLAQPRSAWMAAAWAPLAALALLYFVAAKYARYDPADESPRWPLAARLGAAGFLIPPLLPLSLCLVVSYLLRAERNLSRYLYDYD